MVGVRMRRRKADHQLSSSDGYGGKFSRFEGKFSCTGVGNAEAATFVLFVLLNAPLITYLVIRRKRRRRRRLLFEQLGRGGATEGVALSSEQQNTGSSSFMSGVPKDYTDLHRSQTSPGPGQYIDYRSLGANNFTINVPGFDRGNHRGSWLRSDECPYSEPETGKIPGPGAYGSFEDISSFHKARQKTLTDEQIGFSSTKRRTSPGITSQTAGIPGPGDYDLGLQSIASDLKYRSRIGCKGVFGSSSDRFKGRTKNKEATNQTPMQLWDQGKMLKRIVVLRPVAKSSSSFKSETCRFKGQSSDATPPPTRYLRKDSFDTIVERATKSKSKPFSSTSDRQEGGAFVVKNSSRISRPGAYNITAAKIAVPPPRSRAQTKPILPQGERFTTATAESENTVGPGSHDIAGSLIKKTFNITFGGACTPAGMGRVMNRVFKNRRPEEPGQAVGSLELPSSVPDNPVKEAEASPSLQETTGRVDRARPTTEMKISREESGRLRSRYLSRSSEWMEAGHHRAVVEDATVAKKKFRIYEAYPLTGYAYLKAGKLDEAKKAFLEGMEEIPFEHSSRWDCRLGLEKLGEVKVAMSGARDAAKSRGSSMSTIACAKRALGDSPNLEEAQLLLIQCLLKPPVQEWAKARSLLEEWAFLREKSIWLGGNLSLGEGGGSPRAYARAMHQTLVHPYSLCLRNVGLVDGFEEACEAARAMGLPWVAAMTQRQAVVRETRESAERALSEGRFPSAKAMATRALEEGAGMGDLAVEALLYSIRAEARMGLGETGIAIHDCDQALRRNPNFPEVVLLKARLHKQREHWHSAMKHYNLFHAMASDELLRETWEGIAAESEECREKMDAERVYVDPIPSQTTPCSGHYATLGIRSSASMEEVKQAFKKLALRFHPDKTGGDTASTQIFLQVQAAYKVLSDPKGRLGYDDQLRSGL